MVHPEDTLCLLSFVNDGAELMETNYFDSPQASQGLAFLSWNAGCARLLCPMALESMLSELGDEVAHVVLTKGIATQNGIEHSCIELMFEDHTDSPYSITISTENCDRNIGNVPQSGFVVAIYFEGGLKNKYPGHYRTADTLPCLRAI